MVFMATCNWMREHQPSWSLLELGDKAWRLVEEFWDVNPQEHGASIPHPVVHWSLPPDGCFKENFDTTYFEDSGLAGIGVVCRDQSERAIAALCQNLGRV